VPQTIKELSDYQAHNPSDFSARMGMIYTPLNPSSSPSSGLANQFLNSPATFYTHDSSRNSLIGSSMLSHTDVLPSQANVLVTVDGTVSPFTSQKSSQAQDNSMSAHNRKMSEASAQMVESNRGRGPMNPPAYSAAHRGGSDFPIQTTDSISGQNGPSSIITTSSRPPNEKRQSSSSTVISQSTNMSTPTAFWSHGGPTSLDGAAELISHMNTPAPSEATPAYSGPGPNVDVPRDEKRRPTIMNPTSTEDGKSSETI